MRNGMSLAMAGLLLATAGAANEQSAVSPTFKAAVDAWEAGQALTPSQMNLLRPFVMPGMFPPAQGGPHTDYQTGPDRFGYHAIDSNEPGGPQFNWIDITATGQEVAATYQLGDEDRVGPFPIGFDFSLYGQTYTQFWIQSNGLISFFPTFVVPLNQPIPTTLFHAMIAWCWDDLDPDNGVDGGNIYYQTLLVEGYNTLVVEFVDIDEYPDGPNQDNITAEVLLREDGLLRIQYLDRDLLFDTMSCTVGIQNQDGTIGTGYLYNGQPSDLIQNGLAVDFTLVPATASLTGIVTNAINHEPIANAMVRISDQIGFTDGAGQFTIQDLVPGQQVEVYIHATGYYSLTQTVNLGGDLSFRNFALTPYEPAQQMDYLTTFEVNNGRLGVGSDTSSSWEADEPTQDPPQAHSGVRLWGTRINRLYLPNSRDRLYSLQSFLVQDSTAYFRYWHWYDIEEVYDGYNIQISTDGGETWSLLIPEGGYPDPDGVLVNNWQGCFNDVDTWGQWEQVVCSLADYVGQQVWIGFYFASDPFAQRPGVVIDDLEVFLSAHGQPFAVYIEGQSPVMPQEGGTMLFHMIISNDQPSTATGNMWTRLILPNGNNHGTLTNEAVTVQPGMNTFQHQTFFVPPNAPGGLYTVYAYFGEYPGNPFCESHFNWSKELPGGGDIPSPPPIMPGGPPQLAFHPNPFNELTTISVEVPESGHLSLRLYDITGRVVRLISDETVQPGRLSFAVSGAGLASGVYFLHAELPGGSAGYRKLILLK